jgi:hypothetical protein
MLIACSSNSILIIAANSFSSNRKNARTHLNFRLRIGELGNLAISDSDNSKTIFRIIK